MKSIANLSVLFSTRLLSPVRAVCSQMIANFIESSKCFPFDDIITIERIVKYSFKKEKYCFAKSDICISYYHGAPLIDQNLQYSVTFKADDSESIASLNLKRNSLGRKYSGTVILFHGFRVSKEFLLYSAIYFRFLGYHVVVPDLLGHGESSGIKEYGVHDSKLINLFINNLIEAEVIKSDDFYIVGNSMGALTAIYVSNLRTDIKGVILLAPMPQFDQALYNHSKVTHPILSKIIPEQDIRKGASLVLKKNNINLEDTNIIPLIQSSKIPILLISSDTDRIAPYSDYKGLTQDNIDLVKIHNRNHQSMTTIGDDEHISIIRWLNKNEKE
ncbi:alpha/beta hydrolase [Microbulbifer sp. VAAC004]|uniref:alpha/beta hydrolase n=1 Tax=unclassified Microbulbifer TaxID=2619833 RepID=UPI004039BEEA